MSLRLYFHSIKQLVGNKAKRANLKTEVTRKQSTPNFLKKLTFLTPWYTQEYKARQSFRRNSIFCPLICRRGCAYKRVGNVSFFGKFGVLCFLVTSVLRFAFFSLWTIDELLIEIQSIQDNLLSITFDETILDELLDYQKLLPCCDRYTFCHLFKDTMKAYFC